MEQARKENYAQNGLAPQFNMVPSPYRSATGSLLNVRETLVRKFEEIKEINKSLNL